MSDERNHDLTTVYRQYFESNVNAHNLALLIDSYIRRTDLNIERTLDPLKRKEVRTLKMAVLNITGALSPHVDDTVTFNGRLDPVTSTWMKVCFIYIFWGLINVLLIVLNHIDSRLWNGNGRTTR